MNKKAVENAFRAGFQAAMETDQTEDEAWQEFVESCSDL